MESVIDMENEKVAQPRVVYKSPKLLKKFFIAIGVMIVVFIIVGIFLPNTMHGEKSVLINAPKEKVFPYLNNVKTWPEWTAWNVEKFPSIKYEFAGPTEGVGATFTWTQEGMRSFAKTVIAGSEPEVGIQYEYLFQGLTFDGEIVMREVANGTEVTWRVKGEIGHNIIVKYLYAAGQVKLWYEQAFEESLNSLNDRLAGEKPVNVPDTK